MQFLSDIVNICVEVTIGWQILFLICVTLVRKLFFPLSKNHNETIFVVNLELLYLNEFTFVKKLRIVGPTQVFDKQLNIVWKRFFKLSLQCDTNILTLSLKAKLGKWIKINL